MTHVHRKPRELLVQTRRIYYTELEVCPVCGHDLELAPHYQTRKTVQHLDHVVYVAAKSKQCANPQCSAYGRRYPVGALRQEALPHSSYGLDVVVQIGWWRDREHLSMEEIHQRLQGRVQIGRRHVYTLYEQYRLLLACSEQQRQAPVLEAAAQEYGGLLISLDGLEPEGGHEQLWCVWEVLSGTLLLAAWLPRVQAATLSDLLTPIQAFLTAQGYRVLATLSDKQAALKQALETVWPEAPHQWCQAHYLRNLAAPLYEQDQACKTALRQEIRHALRPSLREVSRSDPQGPFSPSGGDGFAGGTAS